MSEVRIVHDPTSGRYLINGEPHDMDGAIDALMDLGFSHYRIMSVLVMAPDAPGGGEGGE